MNNTEALAALTTRRDTLHQTIMTVDDALQHLREYETEMDNWKTVVVTAKIAAIKTYATTGGVDLSTWDGSEAPAD